MIEKRKSKKPINLKQQRASKRNHTKALLIGWMHNIERWKDSIKPNPYADIKNESMTMWEWERILSIEAELQQILSGWDSRSYNVLGMRSRRLVEAFATFAKEDPPVKVKSFNLGCLSFSDFDHFELTDDEEE